MARPSTGTAKNATFQLRVHRDTLQLFRYFAAKEGVSCSEFLAANINRFIAMHLPSKEAAAAVIKDDVDIAPAVLSAIKDRQAKVDTLISNIILVIGNKDILSRYALTSVQGAVFIDRVDVDDADIIGSDRHYWTLDDLAPWPSVQDTASQILNEMDSLGYSHTLASLSASASTPSADNDDDKEQKAAAYLSALKNL